MSNGPDVQQFRLPDVGEGLTEAEVVSWKVAVGDTVRVNEVLVEIETAKSLVELPSPYAGTVAELLVPEGQTVDVGTPIIRIATGAPRADEGGGPAPAPTASRTDRPTPAPAAPQPDRPTSAAPSNGSGRTAVLVGYGPRTVEAKRRPRKGAAVPDEAEAAVASDAVGAVYAGAAPPRQLLEPADAPAALPGADAVPVGDAGAPARPVLAKPPVRKLAKSLGVDLAGVTPSGAGGIVTRTDVEAAAAQSHPGSAAATAPHVSSSPPSSSPPSSPPATTRVPVKGVRKATAQAMVASAFTAPHVTEWVQVDVTASMELLDRLAHRREFTDVRLSPLVLLMKAVVLAVRRHPGVNASWDEAAQEILLHGEVNLGIAAATPRGLLVPNIPGADRLSLAELANALTDLVTTAREGRTTPQEMQGGTLTITNVGVFGVDGGTPILNPGEAVILCFGAVRELPWVVDGAVVPRQVTTLSLSFDHRLVDGELGSRFLADVAAMMSEPELMVAWG